MSNTRQALGKAFELIRQDKLDEAITIVKPITEAEPENADAWWLLANAHNEPRDARRALVNVLKINPSYPKARDLLDKLNDLYPPRDDELMLLLEVPEVEASLPSAPPPPSAPEEDSLGDPFASEDLFAEDTSAVDDLFSEPAQRQPAQVKRVERRNDIDDLFAQPPSTGGEDDFGLAPGEDPFAALLDEDADFGEGKPRRGRRLLLFTLLLISLLVCVGAVVVLLGGGEEAADDTSDAAASQVAFAPVTVETVNAANATALEDVRLIIQSDAQQRLDPAAEAFYAQVTDGYALMVRVCAQPSPQLPRLARDGMDLVASRVGSTPTVQADLKTIGITLEDCARNNDTLYRATSPLQAAIDYSTQRDFNVFKAAWAVEN